MTDDATAAIAGASARGAARLVQASEALRPTAVARIDLAAVKHNLQVVRRLCPRSRVMAMVKANAYGHGLVPVARALADADGLAVARIEEALALRKAGIGGRVQLLGTLLGRDDLAACSQLDIDVTVHDRSSFAAIDAAAREYPLRVWLKLDSGMHRLGLDPAGFIEADRVLSHHRGVLELGHMTHFASADEVEPSNLDPPLRIFRECHAGNPTAAASLANSAALLTRTDTHAEWVRPGIMIYGVTPVPGVEVDLRPAMQVASRVLAVREIPTGDSVGYNRRWTAMRPSRIATIGIGYGDGYPRHASSGTPVWVHGRHASLAGRVSMDSLSIDVSDIPAVAVGDEVELWGDNLPSAIVADHAGTIHYELFTGITSRVEREYL